MNQNDIRIIRELASRVADLAGLSVQAEKRDMWKRLNALRPVRPMVLIDEIPWHEMDVDGFLKSQCEDPFLRRIEGGLRRTLYRWDHLRCDMVVEPYIEVPRAIDSTGFGIEKNEDTAVTDQNNWIVGHHYKPQIETEEDLEKLIVPTLSEDKTANERREAMAREALGGILDVRMTGMYVYSTLWDTLVEWITPEEVLVGVAERPEFLEAAMDKYVTVFEAMIDQAEQKNLLDDTLTVSHCSYSYTYEDEFPRHKPGEHVSALNCWTDATAQLFGSISAADHDRLEFQYIKRICARFGRVYYGCCEPLHDRMHLVRKLPNVRKVSCSPWCNIDIAAENIHGDFVAVNKPNPAWVAQETFDTGLIGADLRRTRDACARNKTPLEYILKDISTVKYKPQRIWDWADIAMKTVLDG
ncbi:MAG: hypothetical protein GX153_07595 [Clostridiaceae bacterium]|jgi:hypothetical protein|nr:hypothetical protein [Clostridiaceae bacterium]